uniref:hypothetical protein n=1 Tax=Alistipes sp. TaxID=1872444 RepID=UPI0040565C0A
MEGRLPLLINNLMLISSANFCHPKHRIAGIVATKNCEPTESAKRIINDIEAYISIYEPRFLTMLLGPDYDALLSKDASLKSRLQGDSMGYSPIAAYVYFFYMRDFATANTVTGEKIKMAENSRDASAGPRLVRLWNDMVSECIEIAANSREACPDEFAEIFQPVNIFNL